MYHLTNKKIYTQGAPTVQPPPIEINFVKPLSYDFRVAETVDSSGKITKVSLQVQIWEHDEYGNGTILECWADVPRIMFNSQGDAISQP